jgi:hypothetical protein
LDDRGRAALLLSTFQSAYILATSTEKFLGNPSTVLAVVTAVAGVLITAGSAWQAFARPHTVLGQGRDDSSATPLSHRAAAGRIRFLPGCRPRSS